jgi:hypothetical protein
MTDDQKTPMERGAERARGASRRITLHPAPRITRLGRNRSKAAAKAVEGK